MDSVLMMAAGNVESAQDVSINSLKREFGTKLLLLHYQAASSELKKEFLVKYIQLLMVACYALFGISGIKVRTNIEEIRKHMLKTWEKINIDSDRGVKLPPELIAKIDILLDTFNKRIDDFSLDEFVRAIKYIDDLFNSGAKKHINAGRVAESVAQGMNPKVEQKSNPAFGGFKRDQLLVYSSANPPTALRKITA